ncbi:hypothetical protein P3G67_20430 [Streptomyces sp. RB6PN23]|uniref:Uncharacterized protein n=1 Tax=Streptomyces silvisoli TaxID=3034235 RepID=A0ABT5ZPB0_9ACTN|nr:hypothetical protein [Streptomyces silvisoli]MDF3291551.1 hypothetical protein [Streptomyces silvisoli]
MLERLRTPSGFRVAPPQIRLPIERVGRTSTTGIPYLAPEVQLFYKAKAKRDKDETDFEAVLPLLDEPQRKWMAEAVKVIAPDHPWRRRLLQSAIQRTFGARRGLGKSRGARRGASGVHPRRTGCHDEALLVQRPDGFRPRVEQNQPAHILRPVRGQHCGRTAGRSHAPAAPMARSVPEVITRGPDVVGEASDGRPLGPTAAGPIPAQIEPQEAKAGSRQACREPGEEPTLMTGDPTTVRQHYQPGRSPVRGRHRARKSGAIQRSERRLQLIDHAPIVVTRATPRAGDPGKPPNRWHLQQVPVHCRQEL